MQVDILAIGVHPDDIELGCAGTLLAHREKGYTIGLLDLTRGELGSRGSAKIRTKEAHAAAQVLGAKFRANADMADGFFQHSEENLRKIIKVVREARPEIVLANAIEDRHPDHGRAARLIADACYLSGLMKIETHDDQGKVQEKWRPRAVYHYSQDRSRKPDLIVDIKGHFDKKMKAILCYESQFHATPGGQYADEPKTPISGEDFLNYQRYKAAVFAREAGLELAEAFNVERVIAVNDLILLK
ncbi:bacillithiol biosynthesis deacetylase BshB1 [Lewinellaceae bacterium SD302]|nr:bacillithiol biosynthesis deacetylase BshB1 [Lewinellaceae bacterium SD302]